MRSAASFEPALGSCRSYPAKKACEQGVPFTAYFPVDQYAQSLSQGDARLELWTDLPIEAKSAPSTSLTVGWKAVPLTHCASKAGDSEGFVFHVNVKCTDAAIDGAYGFTYRIVHPDGKVDWLGHPSCDGQIYVPSNEKLQQIVDVVHPGQGVKLEAPELPEEPALIHVSMLKPCHRSDNCDTAFRIAHSDVASGIVVERTKSTWCTSRTFSSLSQISSDFGATMIVLRLCHSAQALVLVPVVETNALIKLVRTHHDDKYAFFRIENSQNCGTKISVALGPVDDVSSIITACRSNAARALRTCIQEPLGLAWSAKKLLEGQLGFDVSSPPASETVLSPHSDALETIENSFCSDLTAVETNDADETVSTAASSVEDQLEGPERTDAGIGFCTWEAMTNTERRPYLSEVMTAMKATQKNLGETAITSLLIDDGWQDIVSGPNTRGRLNSFDMDPAVLDTPTIGTSTHNLARYVTTIRTEFPSVRRVGCWMTLAGYWDGIQAGGPIATAMSGSLRVVKFHDPLRNADRDWTILGSDLDMHLFWDRAFHHLKQCGIDFVKIDAQAEWDWIGDGRSTAFEAMEGAATRYFGAGSVIHSMGWVGGLTNSSKTLHSQGMTIRASDDFFPSVPEAHRHHLVHNSYNALQLPEHRCDADMFSSCIETPTSDWTGYHASYRAFTNAHLWISDKADAPRNVAVRGLVAPNLQGESRVLQSRGHLLADSLFEDLVSDGPGQALKLVALNDANGCHTVGLWNTRGGSGDAFDMLRPSSTVVSEPQQPACTKYAAHSFQSHKTWLLSTTEHGPDALPVTLKPGSWDTITFSPVLSLDDVSIAPLGHVNKIMASKGLSAATTAFMPTDKNWEELEEGRFYPVDDHAEAQSGQATIRDPQEQLAMNRTSLMSLLFFNSLFAIFYRVIGEVRRLTPFIGATSLLDSIQSILSRLQAAVILSYFSTVSSNPALLVAAQSDRSPALEAAPPSVTLDPLPDKSVPAKRTRVVSQSVTLVSKVAFLVIPAATPGMQVKINGDLAPFRFSEISTQTAGDMVEVDIPSWYSAQDATELNALGDSFQVQLILP